LNQLRISTAVMAILLSFVTVTMISPNHVSAFTESEIVVASGNITDYIWSSDGTQVAYVVRPEGQSWGELWVGDWNGSGLTNIQMISSEIDAGALLDWQDDWILLRIRRENSTPTEYYGRNELWKIRADGSDLTQITFTYTNGIRTEWWNDAYTNSGTAGWGRFIPGTDLVYFSAHDGNGWWQPYTCNADGTDNWNRISSSTFSFTIGMAPTGNKLVWGSSWYWDMPTTFYSSNVDGTGTVMMKEFSFKTSPLVLADGDTVMYNRPDGDIGAIQVDGTDDRVAIGDEYANYLVNYNPVDGNSFLMRSNRSSGGNFHIFSVDVDGASIVQLTDGPYNVYSAMYSPDGHSILFSRLPEEPEGAPTELVVSWVAKQIEELPSASINLHLVGESPANMINASITFGFYSTGPRIGIGFHQKLLNISTEPSFIRAVGLGYDELRKYSFFTTTNGTLFDHTLIPSVVSHRHYAAWTESQWYGACTGNISEQNITDATVCGVLVEFENLTVYFEDGSTFVCSSQIITLAANFTKNGEIWESNIAIDTSSDEGILIDNDLLTITISFPKYVSPYLIITTIVLISVIAVIASVVYLKLVRTRPEYHDEYVVYY
jgi:hypothetical protein